VSIFAYKLFNAPLDFGVCVCVSEAVFHSVQIRTKKRTETKKEEEAADFVGYLFYFIFFHITINHKRPERVFFLVHRIEYKEKEMRTMKRKKNYYIKKKIKGVDGFCIYDIPKKILFEYTIDY
jgi:hypothetical protein